MLSMNHELLASTWRQWRSFVQARRLLRRTVARLFQKSSDASARQWFYAWRDVCRVRALRLRLIDRSKRVWERKIVRTAFDEWKRVRSYAKRVSRTVAMRSRYGRCEYHGIVAIHFSIMVPCCERRSSN